MSSLQKDIREQETNKRRAHLCHYSHKLMPWHYRVHGATEVVQSKGNICVAHSTELKIKSDDTRVVRGTTFREKGEVIVISRESKQ